MKDSKKSNRSMICWSIKYKVWSRSCSNLRRTEL